MESSALVAPTTPTAVGVLIDEDTVAISAPTSSGSTSSTSAKPSITFVVDRSGSMSGSRIDQVKVGLLKALSDIFASGIRSVDVVLYSSIAENFTVTASTYQSMIRSIVAGGGTSFEAAFQALYQNLRLHTEPNAQVVFMTDGEDASGHPSASRIATLPTKVQYHVISVGDAAANQVLVAILNLGSTPGMFQRTAETPIAQCIDALTPLLTASLVKIAVNRFVYEAEPRENRAVIFVPVTRISLYRTKGRESGHDGHIAVVTSRTKQIGVGDAKIPLEFPAETALARYPYLADFLAIVEAYAETKLRDLARHIQNLDEAEIRRRMEFVSEVLDRARRLTSTLRPLARKTITPRIVTLSTTLRDFNAILAERVRGRITNDLLARLNHTACRDGLKARTAAKLDQRTAENVPKVEAQEQALESYIDSLGDIPESKLPDGTIPQCFGSLETPKELMQNCDCLGLAIEVFRTEAAVMNPWAIRIRLGGSFVSVRTMMEFIANAPAVAVAAPAAAGSGGNSTLPAEVSPAPDARKFGDEIAVVGDHGEKVGGCIPLALSDHHWTVAKALMPQMFGLVCTLDPYGFTDEMTRAVPFVALAQAMCNCAANRTPHTELVLALLSDVCRRIYEEAVFLNRKWPRELAGLVSDWVDKPLVRGKDQVPSISGFLAMISVVTSVEADAPPAYDFDPATNSTVADFLRSNPETFYQLAIFEEIRRWLPAEFVDATPTQIDVCRRRILVSPTSTSETSPAFAAWVKSHTDHYRESLSSSNGGGGGDAVYLARIGRTVAPAITAAAVATSTGAAAPKPFAEVFPDFQAVHLVHGPYHCPIDYRFRQVFESLAPLCLVTPRPLESEILRTASFVMLLKARTNADYRALVEAGEWVDFVSRPLAEAENYLYQATKTLLEAEVTSLNNQALQAFQASGSQKDAQVFATTASPQVARGALKCVGNGTGCMVGRNISVFYDALVDHASTMASGIDHAEARKLFRIKLQMLLTIEFDRYGKWVPGYSRRKRLYRKLRCDHTIFDGLAIPFREKEVEVAEVFARGKLN